MPTLTEKNLKEIAEKLDKLGLPDTLLPTIAQQAKGTSLGFFYVDHKLKINGDPVRLYIALHEKKKGYYMPEFLGMRLRPNKNNLLDQNTFPLPTGADFTVREAYNLMQGRAIQRPSTFPGGDSYWMRLNNEKKYLMSVPELVNSSLSVKSWLEQSPMGLSLTDVQKKTVIAALHAGDRLDITEFIPGAKERVYLVTNPEKNQIEFHSGELKLSVRQEVKQEITHEQRHRKL